MPHGRLLKHPPTFLLPPPLLQGNCADVAPTGVACALDQCNGTAIASGPYCLKTCGRCSTV